MEYSTDAKFKNIELQPQNEADGIIYIQVKNNYQTLYNPFVPLSVFDKHPDVTGNYRPEPLVRYNKLRENHLNNLRGKHNPCDRCPITD